MGGMFLALMATTAACVCAYLASPHQRLRAAPWPARPARIGALALAALGLAASVKAMHPLAGVFLFCIWTMLVLALLPFVGALRTLRRGKGAADGR